METFIVKLACCFAPSMCDNRSFGTISINEAKPSLPTTSEESRMIEVGQAAPPFQVQDHSGNTVRLSDYEGQNVVLWFYPKADTPG